MITYFKDKNHKFEGKSRKKTLTTLLKSIDTFVFTATIYSSILLSLARIRLIVIPTLNGKACGLTISSKCNYEIVTQKYYKYKKNHIRKVNKLLNSLINFIKIVYKIICLIKLNINFCVIFLLDIRMK